MRKTRRSSKAGPFWNRLGEIVRYPLHKEALATIAVLALLRPVAYLGVLGFILDLLITIWLLRYCAEVLVHTARGHDEPPPGYGTWESGWVLLFVQVLLLVAAVFGGSVAWSVGGWPLALLVVLFIGFGTPAALMSAAIDGSLLRALNPVLWLGVFARIGPSYFAAALLYVVIMTSSANLEYFLGTVLPGPIGLVALSFVSHYAVVVIFHLMGDLVRQHHEALGFAQDDTLPPALAGMAAIRSGDADEAVLAEAGHLVTQGDTARAISLLADHLRQHGGRDAVHDRYRRLLRLAGDRAALAAHARDYLNVLIARGDWPRVLQFWSEVRAGDPGVWPTSPSLVRELVTQARDRGRDDLALRFAEGFEAAHPGDSEALRIGLVVAEVLADRRGDVAGARDLLAGLLERFPRSQWRDEADRRLAELAGRA
jgi:hypothetical protein